MPCSWVRQGQDSHAQTCQGQGFKPPISQSHTAASLLQKVELCGENQYFLRAEQLSVASSVENLDSWCNMAHKYAYSSNYNTGNMHISIGSSTERHQSIPSPIGAGGDYRADPNKPIRPMTAASFITQTRPKKDYTHHCGGFKKVWHTRTH